MFYYRNSFWHITVPLCPSVQTLNMFLLRITEPGSAWNLVFPLLRPEREHEAAHWFFKASEGWDVTEIHHEDFRSVFITKDADINEFILDFITISGWWERLQLQEEPQTIWCTELLDLKIKILIRWSSFFLSMFLTETFLMGYFQAQYLYFVSYSQRFVTLIRIRVTSQ